METKTKACGLPELWRIVSPDLARAQVLMFGCSSQRILIHSKCLFLKLVFWGVATGIPKERSSHCFGEGGRGGGGGSLFRDSLGGWLLKKPTGTVGHPGALILTQTNSKVAPIFCCFSQGEVLEWKGLDQKPSCISEISLVGVRVLGCLRAAKVNLMSKREANHVETNQNHTYSYNSGCDAFAVYGSFVGLCFVAGLTCRALSHALCIVCCNDLGLLMSPFLPFLGRIKIAAW